MQDKCVKKYYKGQYMQAEGGSNRGAHTYFREMRMGMGMGMRKYGTNTATAIAKWNYLLLLLNEMQY